MKGVLLSVSRDATIVDITHDIPPQDIAHAAFVIATVAPYFPADTIHVCVVDPGVGTARTALIVETPSGRFIAPDNGLLTYVLAGQADAGRMSRLANAAGAGFLRPFVAPVPPGCTAYELTRSEYWRHPVSDTFHGRDIFAPVAAHVARGVRSQDLGKPVAEVTCLNVPRPLEQKDAVEGRVVFVDPFGNLVSNIRRGDVPGEWVEVEIQRRRIKRISRTYVGGDDLVALIGSHGYLEVAAPGASAARTLDAGVGAVVRVVRADEAGLR